MLLTVVTGAVDVAGGAGLNADVLALQIIRRSDIGTVLNDDDLNALCVGIREIYVLLTIRGNGHASQRHVDGVALQRRNQGIELHIGDLELHAQLVSDSSSDVRIDALYVAVVANELVRRESSVSAHAQRAAVRRGRCGGILCVAAGISGLGAAAAGQQHRTCQYHAQHSNGKLLHLC